MTVAFDHLVYPCKDPKSTAEFFARILDQPPARQTKGFPENNIPSYFVFNLGAVNVDFCPYEPEDFRSGHYGFLVDDETFDAARKRLEDEGVVYAAETTRKGMSENKNTFHKYPDGGRALYFYDENGHNVEFTTKSEHANMTYLDD